MLYKMHCSRYFIFKKYHCCNDIIHNKEILFLKSANNKMFQENKVPDNTIKLMWKQWYEMKNLNAPNFGTDYECIYLDKIFILYKWHNNRYIINEWHVPWDSTVWIKL